jgi:hypothetical protein
LTEFQTDKKSLLHLIGQIENRELALPDFQRSFVWEASATRELVSSIVRSFPAGTLLFVQGSDAMFAPRPFEHAPTIHDVTPPYLVLDGQQRLTSLYLALTGQGTHRFYLDLNWLLEHPEEDDIDDAVLVYHRSRARQWATLEGQAKDLVLPLSSLRGWANWRDEVLERRDLHGEDRRALASALNQLNERCIKPVEQYQFPLTILGSSTTVEAVCTIFETLNRTGVKLSVFELLTARAYAENVKLRDLWSQSLFDHPILGDFEVDPYYVLQVVALLEGRSPKRSEVLKLAVPTIAKRWEEAAHGVAGTLTLLRQECGVLAAKWLPYQTMLLTLGAVWPTVNATSGPAVGARRTKLKRYFWCAAFTGRYENAPNTVADQDAPVLRDWMSGGAEPAWIAAFKFDDVRWRETTGRQRALYQASIALLMSRQVLDFHSANLLDHHVVAGEAVDDHHIFPRAYLEKTGQSGAADTVLNHTLIDKTTNILISAKAPSDYLAEMREQLGAVKLVEILRSHSLPDEADGPLWSDRYEDFLAWRQEHFCTLLATATAGD